MAYNQDIANKSAYLVVNFASDIQKHAKAKGFKCSNVQTQVIEDNLKLLLNIENSIISISFSKNTGMTQVSSVYFRQKGDKAIPLLRETLEPVFGLPSVSYQADTDSSGILTSSTFEWAEKGKEKESVRDVKRGKGLEPYYRVYNIVDYTNQSQDNSEKV